MKTATIERYHCYGTPNHHIRVTYRGNVLRWRDSASPGLSFAMADTVDRGSETIGAMIEHARRHGFTHARFTGDWKGRTMQKTMALSPKRSIVFKKDSEAWALALRISRRKGVSRRPVGLSADGLTVTMESTIRGNRWECSLEHLRLVAGVKA